jgi:hypothetical protein
MGSTEILVFDGEWLTVWRDGAAIDFEPAQLVGGINAVPIADRVVATGLPEHRHITGRDGVRRQCRMTPVRPPVCDDPIGVQLWVGGSDETPPPPRRVGALSWDHAEMHATVAREFLTMSSTGSPPARTALSPSSLTSKLVHADDEERLLSACLNPQHAPPRLSGHIVVVHDCGDLMRWRYTGLVNSECKFTLRGFCHDTTDHEPPVLDHIPSPQGQATALLTYPIDGSPPNLTYWLSGQSHWLFGEHLAGPVPAHLSVIVHPDDLPRLRHVATLTQPTLADTMAPICVRVRHTSGRWMDVDVTLSRLPTSGTAGDRAHIMHLNPVHQPAGAAV